jgi:hypothetical protein
MNVTRSVNYAVAVALLAMAWPGWLPAHHSTAIYDSDHPVELAGTVVEWKFTNPHCFIILESIDATSGERTVWNLEGGNTAGLFRRGWTPATLKPGDKIMVTARVLRSGAPGGNYSNPRWADGTPIDPRPSGSAE